MCKFPEDEKCSKCGELRQTIDGVYYCVVTGANLEKISSKPSWCPHKRNCHEYCHYAKYCRYEKGTDGMNPDECAMYYKIDDLMNDARIEAAEERRREREEEEGEDW